MTESTLPPRSRLAALIDEARRRGRRRNVVLASLLALLVAGGIWAGLDLTGGGGGAATVHAPPGFHVVQSQGPVARQVLQTWTSAQPVSVDIATGTERPLRTTSAIWYDRGGDVTRVVTRADGRVQTDYAAVCSKGCHLGFSFRNLWPLDPSRYTRQPGIGTFHGRRVIWIAPRQPGGFAAPPNFGERIGLDPRTHEPVADRVYFNGKVQAEALVLERKPDLDNYAFVVPNRTNRPVGKGTTPELSVKGSDPHALQARLVLGRTPLWLGERFLGSPLQAVTIASTSGIGPKPAKYVFYDYGNVAIAEFNAGRASGWPGSLPGRLTVQKPDLLLSPRASRSVTAQLNRDGVLVNVQVSQHGNFVLTRARALQVARSLRPVPLP
jgi:hypothetical protein